jgi:uncharacterized protein (TIGR03437 family)
VALHSILFTPEPFSIASPLNPGSDKRTRIILFGTNINLLAGEDSSAATVNAVSSSGGTYQLAVEFVGKVSGFDWLSMIEVRLPDDSSLQGDISVNLTIHGATSNNVPLSIKAP